MQILLDWEIKLFDLFVPLLNSGYTLADRTETEPEQLTQILNYLLESQLIDPQSLIIYKNIELSLASAKLTI